MPEFLFHVPLPVTGCLIICSRSHLDSAVSEKIVPSGHGSHENPEGIEEARRILLLHLKSR